MNCRHVGEAFRAHYRLTLPVLGVMDACADCAGTLRRRFLNVDGFKCEPIIDRVREQKPLPLNDAATEATPYELETIKRLDRCSLRMGTFDKRFIHQAATAQAIPSFSAKGRAILALLLWRYRRQNSLTPGDQEYLAVHLTGIERKRWEESR